MNRQPHSQLLTHIVSKWTNRTEDVAVDALGFILIRSRSARTALQGVLETFVPNIGALTDIKTQVPGEDGARPDLVVFGNDGAERVLIEAKFWAGLTENQPGAYLARLPLDDTPSVLLFVAPEARLESLWNELLRRTDGSSSSAGDSQHDGIKCRLLNRGRQYLILTSWRMLLDRMLVSCTASADSIESDIRQLQALCEQQDTTAFLPIKPEEFAPVFPRRMLQLNQLIDDAVERALERGIVKTGLLRKTPLTHGYGRYLKLGSERGNRWAGAWFGVNIDLWAEYEDTPLWLMFSHWDGVLPLAEVRQALGDDIWTNTPNMVPVHLPTRVEKDRVLAEILELFEELAGRLILAVN